MQTKHVALVSEPLTDALEQRFRELAVRYARATQLALDTIHETGIHDLGRIVGRLKTRIATLTNLPDRLIPSAVSYALMLARMNARTVRSNDGIRLLHGAYQIRQNGSVIAISVLTGGKGDDLKIIFKTDPSRRILKPQGRVTLKLATKGGRPVVRMSMPVPRRVSPRVTPQFSLPI